MKCGLVIASLLSVLILSLVVEYAQRTWLKCVCEDERESVQKKTFAKWVNSHLMRVNCSIQDLYVDLRDGKMLIKLLEVLSGERLVSFCCLAAGFNDNLQLGWYWLACLCQ